MTFDEMKEGYLDAVKNPEKSDEFLTGVKADYEIFEAAGTKISEYEKQIAELMESKNKLLEKLILRTDVSDEKAGEPEEEKTGIDWDEIIKEDKENADN